MVHAAARVSAHCEAPLSGSWPAAPCSAATAAVAQNLAGKRRHRKVAPPCVASAERLAECYTRGSRARQANGDTHDYVSCRNNRAIGWHRHRGGIARARGRQSRDRRDPPRGGERNPAQLHAAQAPSRLGRPAWQSGPRRLGRSATIVLDTRIWVWRTDGHQRLTDGQVQAIRAHEDNLSR